MSKSENKITESSDPFKHSHLYSKVASVLLVILLFLTIFLPERENPYLRAAGVLTLILAALFIFLPFYYLSRYGQPVKGDTYLQSNQVVDHGPYAIVRHPQYLGYSLLGCGFAILRQNWVIVLLAVFGTVFFYLQAVEEEKICLSRFGDDYAKYSQHVPRFNFILGLMRALFSSKL